MTAVAALAQTRKSGRGPRPAQQSAPAEGAYANACGQQNATQPPARIVAPLIHAATPFPLRPLPLQRKLAVGETDDPLEAEADAVAESVLSGGALTSIQPGAPAVRRKAAGVVTPTEAPPIVHQVLRSPGQALDSPTRSFMESRFGQDFAQVRIHTGPSAGASAQAVQAQAWTLGNNVVFAPGKYDPASREGKRLLAHELTHTIQQQYAGGHRNLARMPGISSAHSHCIQRDPAADEAARIAKLVQEYDDELAKARTSGDWKIVAEKLNGFAPADIVKRLEKLTSAEVTSMHAGAAANKAVGPNSNAALYSLPGWSDGVKWNKGVKSVSQVRRIPIEGLREGNQNADLDTDPDKKKEAEARKKTTAESANGKAIVLMPDGLDLSKPVEVLLFLHGHNIGYRERGEKNDDPGTVRDVEYDRMEQQIKASGHPMIGILPQGTRGSGFGPNFNSDPYIADVFRVLSSQGAFGDQPAPQISRVIFGGHSGAGAPIADILGEKGQPRLSAKIGEVALFDAINGPNELGKVTHWVTERLNLDLAELTKAGTTEAQQLAYLQTSMRFRAYYTNSSYKERHETLNASIVNWFSGHKKELGGEKSPTFKALRDNYQVIPVGHGDHNMIVGRGSKMEDAIDHLPQGSAPASGSNTAPPSTSGSAGPPDTIQRKAENAAPVESAALPLAEEVIRSSGRPLDQSLRSFFQPRFNRDLSQVRVHTDDRAAQSARALHARAYAVNSNLVFADGQYDPHSALGRRLIAHELAHVAQQDKPAAAPRNTVRRNVVPPDLNPIRADEAGKKLKTFTYGEFLIFVPDKVSKAATGPLNVHVFFSAGAVQGDQGNDVLTHGMRGASAGTDWVMIGVPAFPATNTISDAEIVESLKSVGIYRPMTSLRLSGHSRGGSRLVNSVDPSKITTLSLIDRVTLLDTEDNPDPASPDHKTITPKSEQLRQKGIPAAKIVSYEVNVHKRHIPGVHYIPLSSGAMSAIGYVRLIEDSMVTKPGISALVSGNPAIKNQLDSLHKVKPKAASGSAPAGTTTPMPARGSFTTGAPKPGQVSLQTFSNDYNPEIQAILNQDNSKNGLLKFINDNDLVRFNNGPRPYVFSRAISAHHFFVAEVAHELTE